MPEHGTDQGYQAGCRLECCRTAHREYNARKKAERIARGIPLRVHGTRNGYVNYGCRCDRCKIASLKAT